MHLSGNFSSEAQLNEKLDFIYQQSKLGRVFHGILEVATNKVTIITAVHKIKSNKGAMTAGIDGFNVNKYLQMDMDELINLVQKNMYKYWLCINCHRKIHGKEPVQGLSSKTIKKIEKYIKSLKEVS